MTNLEQVEEWFEKYGDWEYTPKLSFDTLETKYNPCEQVSALIFLTTKLKESEKIQNWFLHGEHDIVYIGESLDIFEDFTEEDVKIAVAHGISLSTDGEGFEMYASM